MSSNKLFRIILLCAAVIATAAVITPFYKGEKLPGFIVFFLVLIPVGYGIAFLLRALNWIAFSGSEGDGLRLIPLTLKILSLPVLPFIALGRFSNRCQHLALHLSA